MRRFTLVTSFVAILGPTLICPSFVAADPVVISASRYVHAETDVPYNGSLNTQHIGSNDTSGVFTENVSPAETQVEGTAASAAAQDTSISPFLFGGTGTSSGVIQVLDPGVRPYAYGISYFNAFFTLYDSYDYSFSGLLQSSGAGDGFASLFRSPDNEIHTSDSSGSFSFLGTLGPGTYGLVVYAQTYPYPQGALSGNANFDFAFALTPSAAVSDGGHTAVMFLLGTFLLGIFAVRQQRREQALVARPVVLPRWVH